MPPRKASAGPRPFEATRRCTVCGETKPLDDAHWSRSQWRRADGSIGRGPFVTRCKRCNLARVKQHAADKKTRKQAGRPPPAPIQKALKSLPLPKVEKPTFRGTLQAKAEAQWPKIAEQMIGMAAKGDKVMIKLVAAYVLGVPREASEDDGPTEFWSALLARAGQPDAGAEPDLGAAPVDLVPGDRQG